MSLSPFYDIERPLRLMERQFHRRPEEYILNSPFHQLMPRELQQLIPREFHNPQRFFEPLDYSLRRWENFMKPMEELAAAMNHIALKDVSSNVIADDEKFQVRVDVQHFAPEEINVKVIDRHVVVEGKHEEKQDEHGYITRQFIRRFALPEGCLPDTVQSSLSSDGVLTVTAPKVLAMPSTGERIVPITHTGPVNKQIGSPDFEPKETSSPETKNE